MPGMLGRGVQEGRRLVRLCSLIGHKHLHRSPGVGRPERRLHRGQLLARSLLQCCILLPHLAHQALHLSAVATSWTWMTAHPCSNVTPIRFSHCVSNTCEALENCFAQPGLHVQCAGQCRNCGSWAMSGKDSCCMLPTMTAGIVALELKALLNTRQFWRAASIMPCPASPGGNSSTPCQSSLSSSPWPSSGMAGCSPDARCLSCTVWQRPALFVCEPFWTGDPRNLHRHVGGGLHWRRTCAHAKR